ncbi:unnamed protein product [Auanema sp. JU1783]|nr:unnamed protein product [Auanema sp. JU1783]
MSSYIGSAISTIRFVKDYAFNLGAYLLASRGHKSMPTLTPIDSISALSPLVIRILGQNPGPFTLQGTNTYLIGNGKKRILVDTGEPNISKYISELKSALGENEIDSIIVTHWHNDHVGGLPSVIENVVGKKVPVYKFRKIGGEEDPEHFTYVEDGQEVKVDGATVRFVHTPGHTIDHAALYLLEENALFSADCILGEGTTVFEDLHDYMCSLDKIKSFKASRIYPGHGPVIEKTEEKVDEYIGHRVKRENEILNVLTEQKQMTSMDITNTVYQASPWSVRLAALNNVKLVLNKLIKDEKVQKTGFEMYRIVE